MSTNKDFQATEGLNERREEEPISQFAAQDEDKADEIDTAAYENPEFFTPKEISFLLLSQSVHLLNLFVDTGSVSVEAIRKSADLAALNISLALDDASIERIFEKSRLMTGSDINVLIEARQRLGTAIDDPGKET